MYLSSQLNRSDRTVSAYRRNLEAFFDYILGVLKKDPQKFKFTDCSYDLVLNYSKYMQTEKKYSPSTVNQNLAAIKSYLRFVSDEDFSLVQVSLAINKVPELKVPKKIRTVLDNKYLTSLLEAPSNSIKGNRDQMILILLYDSAIRVSELVNIKMGDIKIQKSGDPTILINGKGRKQRTIEVSTNCGEHLKKYIKYYRNGCSKDSYLFYRVINGKEDCMTTRNIQKIVKKYSDIVRESLSNMPVTSPHTLRRTRATGLVRDGIALEVVSTLLGHEFLETTREYAYPSDEQMRTAINSACTCEPENEETPLWVGHEDDLKRLFGFK